MAVYRGRSSAPLDARDVSVVAREKLAPVATLDKALLVVLLYNCVVGFADGAWSYFRPGILAVAPTHFSWVWLPIIGAAAAVSFRSSHIRFHLLAALFYLPQIVTLFGPTTVELRAGLNFGFEFGDPEGRSNSVFGVVNVVALVLTALQCWRLTKRWSGP